MCEEKEHDGVRGKKAHVYIPGTGINGRVGTEWSESGNYKESDGKGRSVIQKNKDD